MKHLKIKGAAVLLLLLLPLGKSSAQLDAIVGLLGKMKDAAILAEQLVELKKMTQNLMDVYEKTASAIQGFKAVKDLYKRGSEVSGGIAFVAKLMAEDPNNAIYSTAFKTKIKAGINEALDEMSLSEESVSIALRSAKLTMKERMDIVDQGMNHMNKALRMITNIETAAASGYDNYQIAANRGTYFTVIYGY